MGQHSRKKAQNGKSGSIREQVSRANLGSATLLVNDKELTPVQISSTLREYARELGRRGSFIYADARARAFSAGRDTYLGRAWLILQPLIDILLYGLIFGVVLKTNRGIENFVGYLVIGIVFFGFFSKQFLHGNGLLRSQKGLLNSFNFPRATVVFSGSLRLFFDSLPPAAVALVAALLTQPSLSVSPKILAVIPVFILFHLFGTGAMFFSARMTALVPDLQAIMKLTSRVLFYLSGIFFSIDRFVNHEILKTAMELNPLYQFLSIFRGIILSDSLPSLSAFLGVALWSILVFTFGFIYFYLAEGKYGNLR